MPGGHSDTNSSPVWPGPLKGDPYKVLVVDDDPVCLKTVEQMLRHCNYLGEGLLCKALEQSARLVPGTYYLILPLVPASASLAVKEFVPGSAKLPSRRPSSADGLNCA